MSRWYKRNKKTVAAVVTGGIGWGAAVVASAPGPVSAGEYIMGATVLATALGVYATTNEP